MNTIKHFNKTVLFVLLFWLTGYSAVSQGEIQSRYIRSEESVVIFGGCGVPSSSEAQKCVDISGTSGNVVSCNTPPYQSVDLTSLVVNDLMAVKTYLIAEINTDMELIPAFDYSIKVTLKSKANTTATTLSSPIEKVLQLKYINANNTDNIDRYVIDISDIHTSTTQLYVQFSQIEVLDNTLNGPVAVNNIAPYFKVRLSSSLEVYETAAFPSSPTITLVEEPGSNTNKDLLVTMDAGSGATFPKPCWFELQWVFAADGTYSTELFEKNASRVIIGEPTYTIPNSVTQSGKMLARYRIIRPLYDPATKVIIPSKYKYSNEVAGYSAQAKSDSQGWIYTSWSDPGNINPKMNSSFSVTYSENGKRQESLEYFDGTGRPRQTINRIAPDPNYEEFSIVSDIYYNFEGNAVIQTIPELTKFKSLGFQFNDSISKHSFDLSGTLPAAISNGGYFGGASTSTFSNFPNNKFVPNSDGYAFSYTELDGAGRPTLTTKPGYAFRADGGKTSTIEFAQPTQADLDLFFGNNATHESNYSTVVTTDENGETSIAYVDRKDRTVLTGITTSGNNALLNLDTKPKPIYIDEDLLKNPQSNSKILSGTTLKGYRYEKTVFLTQNSDVKFDYSFTKSFIDYCLEMEPAIDPALCYTCEYSFKVQIVNAKTGVVVLDTSSAPFVIEDFLEDESCGGSVNWNGSASHSESLTKGKYLIKKELLLVSDTDINLMAEDYIEQADFNECIDDEFTFIESETRADNEGKYTCETEFNTEETVGPCEQMLDQMKEDMVPAQGIMALTGADPNLSFSIFNTGFSSPNLGANQISNSTFSTSSSFVSQLSQGTAITTNTNEIAYHYVGTNTNTAELDLITACSLTGGEILKIETYTDPFYFALGHPLQTSGSEPCKTALSQAPLGNNIDTEISNDEVVLWSQEITPSFSETYTFQVDFDAWNLIKSAVFINSTLSVYIDDVLVGSQLISDEDQLYHPNFSYTFPSNSTPSVSRSLTITVDYECRDVSPNIVRTTLFGIALDNIAFRAKKACDCTAFGLTNPGNFPALYPYQCLWSTFDAEGIFASMGDGFMVNPATLTIAQFIDAYEPDWLDELILLHPSYCAWEDCEEIHTESSNDFIHDLDNKNWSYMLANYSGIDLATTSTSIVKDALYNVDPIISNLTSAQLTEFQTKLETFITIQGVDLTLEQFAMYITYAGLNLNHNITSTVEPDLALLNELLNAAEILGQRVTYSSAFWSTYSAMYSQLRQNIAKSYGGQNCLSCESIVLSTQQNSSALYNENFGDPVTMGTSLSTTLTSTYGSSSGSMNLTASSDPILTDNWTNFNNTLDGLSISELFITGTTPPYHPLRVSASYHSEGLRKRINTIKDKWYMLKFDFSLPCATSSCSTLIAVNAYDSVVTNVYNASDVDNKIASSYSLLASSTTELKSHVFYFKAEKSETVLEIGLKLPLSGIPIDLVNVELLGVNNFEGPIGAIFNEAPYTSVEMSEMMEGGYGFESGTEIPENPESLDENLNTKCYDYLEKVINDNFDFNTAGSVDLIITPSACSSCSSSVSTHILATAMAEVCAMYDPGATNSDIENAFNTTFGCTNSDYTLTFNPYFLDATKPTKDFVNLQNSGKSEMDQVLSSENSFDVYDEDWDFSSIPFAYTTGQLTISNLPVNENIFKEYTSLEEGVVYSIQLDFDDIQGVGTASTENIQITIDYNNGSTTIANYWLEDNGLYKFSFIARASDARIKIQNACSSQISFQLRSAFLRTYGDQVTDPVGTDLLLGSTNNPLEGQAVVSGASMNINGNTMKWYDHELAGQNFTLSTFSGFTFQNLRPHANMLAWTRFTPNYLASLLFFEMDAVNTSSEKTITLTGFYKENDGIFYINDEHQNLFDAFKSIEDRVYCPEFTATVEDFLETDAAESYFKSPYMNVLGTSTETEIINHPYFASSLTGYVNNILNERSTELIVQKMMASCESIDKINAGSYSFPMPGTPAPNDLTTLLQHFPEDETNLIDPICAYSLAESDCEDCEAMHEAIIDYQYLASAIDMSETNIKDNVLNSTFLAGLNDQSWYVYYNPIVDSDNWNSLYASKGTEYAPFVLDFLNYLIDPSHEDVIANGYTEPTFIANTATTVSSAYNSVFDPTDGFDNFDFSNAFNGGTSFDTYFNVGTSNQASMWIQHCSDGKIWIHFYSDEDDVDVMEDIWIDYDYNNSSFELEDIVGVSQLQPIGNGGITYEAMIGLVDNNDDIHPVHMLTTFPLAYICEMPYVSFYRQPSNDALVWEESCEEAEYEAYYAEGQKKYLEYLETIKEDFVDNYKSVCLKRSNINESLMYGRDNGIYNYTLYYYDQADNLRQTVPPNGVNENAYVNINSTNGNRTANMSALNAMTQYRLGLASPKYPEHDLMTKYFYNSVNQLIKQETPDGGVSQFAYDKLARLGLSQSAQQSADKKFSYTLFDELGRIEEVGEFNTINVTFDANDLSYLASGDEEGKIISLNNLGVSQTSIDALFNLSGSYDLSFTQFEWLLKHLDYEDFVAIVRSELRNDVVVSQYDTDPDYTISTYGYGEELNLLNRVSAMYKYKTLKSGDEQLYQNAIMYHYDPVGNVRRVIREYKNYNYAIYEFKIMEYEYDQISGNVKQFSYQPGQEDSWYHKYNYDANNRLEEVLTSRNGEIWDVDANYEYYGHGPLASIQLGEYLVQKNDYTYTLQGWLKMMNGLEDISAEDPNIPKDVYSQELNYYVGDYSPASSVAYSGAASSNALTTANSLYNGNIQGIAQSTATATHIAQDSEFETVGKNYTYDQLNRIKNYLDREVDMSGSTPTWTDINGLNGVSTNYTFDQAGNITTLDRFAQQNPNPSSSYQMDNLAYSYYPHSNKLRNYHEDIDENLFSLDLDNTGDLSTYFYVLSVVTSGMAPEEYDSYCLDGQEQFTNLYPFNPSGSTNWSVNAGEWEYADETSTVFSPNFYITIDTIFIELTECPGGAQHVFIVKVTAPTQDGYIYDLSGNLIQDLNEGLVTSWNPQGKVAEVTFDQKEESSQVYHGNNIEVPSGFPNPQTYTYPCGPGTSSTATFQFQTFTNGKLSFEYDPMGERMIKEKKIINEYCITCFGATNSGVCFEPVESQSFDLYIRDAQGNVIAMYALDTNMEAIDHYEFYSEFLNNAEDADGLDYSDLRTGFFDNLAVTDGKFLDLAKEYSGVSDAALLARMDIEEILDDNPQLLSQLMSGYGDIHLSGFFNDANYTSWLKTQIRNTSAYQNYAQTKAEELADIDMEDELLAYAGYRGDMANDAQTLHNRLMTCVQNNQPNCDADIDCYNCEADLLNDDVAAYDLCISNLGCDPNNYCTDCDREYSDYRAVGDLLRVPYDYDQLVDAYYLELTTPGGIGDNLEHFFNTGVSPATPLSHTTQTMNGAVITGSANFRTYLDDYYDNNPWESQITSLISTDALVQDYFVAHLSTLVYNDVLNKAAINSGESGYTDEQYLAYMLDEERSSYSITNFLDGIASTFGPEKPGLLLHVQDSPYYVAYPEKHGLLPDSPGDMLVYTIEPKEYYIYGSSRLGSLKHYNAKPDANTNLNKLGHKSYELTDHLGNVHATVSDRKLVADTDQDGTPDAFVADLQTSNDYFPYGMLIPSRSYNYNPMELVNDFDTVQRTVTTENLTTNITPDFSGGELASGAGLWEAVLYADNGSLLATHTESYSGWYLGGNNVEMILHENDAQRVILKRHINTNELSTLNANDRIEVSFRLAKNDTNLLSTQSPNLSATWRLRNNTSGQVEQSGSISFPYNNGYKTVIIAFIANASDYTIEVEYEFVQKTMHYTHPIRVAAMRLFNLRHYDISTNTFNEVVNNQYERQGIYRYGFQGQERDDEISGIGNSYTANFWQYDPRLGRRWNIDPVFKSHESPYASIANNPVWLIDPNGADTTINGKPNFDGLNLSDGETVTFVYMGKRGPGNYTDGLDRESFIYHAGNENFEAGFYSPSDYAYVHLDYDNNQVMPPMNYLEWTLFEGQDRFISGVDGKEYEVDRNGYLTGEERPIVLDPFIFFGGPGRKGVQIIAAGYRANKLYAVSRTIISIVKQDETLLKFARQTFQGNNQLRTEANSLLQQLKLGNLNPGIGTKNIGKNIFEARSRGGARVYFRNSSDGLEILGYSSKSNQQKVINRLLETY